MSSRVEQAFGSTLHTTEVWLKETMQAVHENVQGNGVRARGEEIVRAVFRVLGQRVSAGEIADLRATLPHEFATYWPAKHARV